MAKLKQTPLYEYYQENDVKLVDFGGWAMPMQFSGIIKEHKAVRERVGLFDCSHMGEIFVSGPDAEDYLNSLLTNNVSRMTDYSVQYNVFCLEDGGAIDDVMLYRQNKEAFIVVCNASNTEKVWAWMQQHEAGELTLEDKSDQIGLLAVQGPLAEEILQGLTETNLTEIKRHTFQESVVMAEVDSILISRTGYTGEDGFELYVPAEQTRKLWDAILEKVLEKEGLVCGLGARDTLRLEAGLPLYGQELTTSISPIMAGIGFAVKTKKAIPFIGQDALREQREAGTKQKVVGFKMLERGIPRNGYEVFLEDGQLIGTVTSGTQSPMLKQGIGMALIDSEHTAMGTEIFIGVRNKKITAEITKKTFYDKKEL